MICTAWNNGAHSPSGAGYGLKIGVSDRDSAFKRTWDEVTIELPAEEGQYRATANVQKASFWGPECRELITNELGLWLLQRELAPWPEGSPPKFVVVPVAESRFRLLGKLASPGELAAKSLGEKMRLPDAAQMICPHCGVRLDEHASSRCLDRWVHYAMGGRPITLVSEEEMAPEVSREDIYYRHPNHGLFALPEYSSDMNAAWCFVLDRRYDPPEKRDHFLSTLETILSSMRPSQGTWPQLLLHIQAVIICIAAIAAIATADVRPSAPAN